MKTIHITEGYLLHIQVNPIASQPNQSHLHITSTWVGAKHPSEHRTLLSICAATRQIQGIANAITEQIKHDPTSCTHH